MIKMNVKQRKNSLLYFRSFAMIIFSRKIETLMHIIKGNIGAGILAFPYALSKAGLLVRTFFLIFYLILLRLSLDQLHFGSWV